MKIFALTTFIICLVCVLSLSTESFESNETQKDFQKTCKDIKFGKNKLTGSCKNKKGKFVKASLDLNTCIMNKLGVLTHGGKDFGKSSKNCKANKAGTTLTCKCKKGKVYIKSSIKLDTILSNNDGKLQCDAIATKANKKAKGKAKAKAKGKAKRKAKAGKKKF